MLKVVIDTNQFISSLINKRGPSAELLSSWREHRYVLVLSSPIVEEIQRVLQYPHIFKKYNLVTVEIESLLNLLRHDAVMVSAAHPVDVIKEDPDDNKFLACAVAAEADYIVSGDGHLLNLGKYKNVRILTVNEFLKILKEE